MSDENRAIAVIPVKTGEIRNKTVNMIAIQLAELGSFWMATFVENFTRVKKQRVVASPQKNWRI